MVSERDRKIFEDMLKSSSQGKSKRSKVQISNDKRIFDDMKKSSVTGRQKTEEETKKGDKAIFDHTRKSSSLESITKIEKQNLPTLIEPNVPETYKVVEEMLKQGKLYPKPYDIAKIKESYKDVEAVSKKLLENQKKFDLLLKAKYSPVLRLFLKAKDKLSEYLFGKKGMSIDDLFEEQLRNINEFTNDAEPVLNISEKVLDNFRNARDSESAEARTDYEERKTLETEIPRLYQELIGEREIFRQLPYESNKYLGQQLKIRNLEREFEKKKTKFRIISNSFAYKEGLQEIHFGGVEEWVRVSVDTGKEVLNHAKKVTNALNHIYPLIKAADNVWKVIGKTEESFKKLKCHTEELYTQLSQGILKMREIVNNGSSADDIITGGDEKIKGLLNYTQKNNVSQKAQSLIDRLDEIERK